MKQRTTKLGVSLLASLLCVLFAWSGVCLLDTSSYTEPTFAQAEVSGETEEVTNEKTFFIDYFDATTGSQYTVTYAVLDENSVSVQGFSKVNVSAIAIKLPKSVENSGKSYTIKKIAEDAFGAENSIANVETVDLSATEITSIEKNAFRNNTELVEVIFPSVLEEIGEYAFLGCGKLVNVELPTLLTSIKAGAFKESGLTKLTIPEKVTKIEEETFYKTKISALDLGNVKEIGARAFYGISLTTLQRSDSLERIGESAFEDSSLATVRTGEKLSFVGAKAFWNNALKYFDIGFDKPNQDWGENVFKGESVKLLRIADVDGWNGCYGLSVAGQWVENLNGAQWQFSTVGVLDMYGNETIDKIANNEKKLIYDSHGLIYKFYRQGSASYYATVCGYDMDKWHYGKDFVVPEKVIYNEVEYFVREIDISNATANKQIYSVYIGEGINFVSEKSFPQGSNGEEYPKEIYIKSTSVTVHTNAWQNKRIVFNYGSTHQAVGNIYTNYELTNSFDQQGIRYYLDDEYGFAVVGDVASGDDVSANTSKYTGSDFYTRKDGNPGEAGHAVIPDFVSSGNKYYRVVGIGRYAFYNSKSLSKITLGAFVGIGIDDAKIERDVKNEKVLVEGVFDSSGNLVEAGVSDCAFRNCQYLNNFYVDERNDVYMTDANNDLLLEKGLNAGGRSDSPVKIVKAGKNVTSYTSTTTNIKYEIKKDDGTISKVDGFSNINTVENYAFANCTRLTAFDFTNVVLIGEHAFENTGLKNVTFATGTEVGDYAFANAYAIQQVAIGASNKLGRFVFLNCYSIQAFTSQSDKYLVQDGVLYESFGTYAVLLQYPAAKMGSDFTVDYCGSLPVKEIEAYAFGYSQLTKIVVSEQVLFVGKAAFHDCTKLMNVTIGGNVVAIGIEIKTQTDKDTNAYYTPSYEAGTFDRDAWYIYEREVFDGCNVLSGITVNKNNEYYLTDDNGILYNKDKTTLLVYAQGITRVSYTVPMSVTKIGIEAFENNVHLKRLILNENVETVEAKAFNGCTKLYSIYFRSPLAPWIGEQVFNSTGSLVNGGLHVYCIPDPSVWLALRGEIWGDNAELVEKYVSIQEVPDQAQPTSQVYLIYVVDSDGNYLPDMKVDFGYKDVYGTGSIVKTLYANDTGYAVLTLPPNLDQLYDGNKVKLTISDESGVYYTYENDKFYLDLDLGFSYVTLRSVPTLQGVSCDGEDIDTGRISINMSGNYWIVKDEVTGKEVRETYDSEVVVNAGWDKAATFNGISLWLVKQENGQTKEVKLGEITEIPDADFEDHGASKSALFYFTITVDQIKEHVSAIGQITDYYYEVRLDVTTKGEDGNKHEIKTEELNIDLFYVSFTEDGSVENGGANWSIFDYFNLDKKVHFKVDQQNGLLSLFSNMEFDFFLEGRGPGLTIQPDGNKVFVGINFHDAWDLDKTPGQRKYRNKSSFAKKMTMALNERIKEFKKTAKRKGAEGVGNALMYMRIAGGVELELNGLNELPKITSGMIKGYVQFEYEYDAPILFVPVPIIVTLPVQFEMDFKASGELTLEMKIDELLEGKDFWDANVCEVEINVGVDLYGGVGCAMVSAGIYGHAGFELLVEIGKSIENFVSCSGTVLVEAGVYIKIDVGFLEWKKKQPIASITNGKDGSITFTVTNPFGGLSDQDEQALLWSYEDGSGMHEFDTLNEAISYSLFSMDTAFQPFAGIYENYGRLDAQVVSYKGKYYKFYIDNVISFNGDKQTQYTAHENANSYNYLKLVYQEYENGTWTAPRIINTKDANNETAFNVYADENGIHLVYNRVNRELNEQNAESYVTSLDVYQTTFKDGVFSTPIAISTSENYKYGAEIISSGDTLYATWIENADNNAFGMSFDENGEIKETNANSVWLAALKDGRIIGTPQKVDGLSTVADIEFSLNKGELQLFVLLDKDCDISTMETVNEKGEVEQDRFLYALGVVLGNDNTMKIIGDCKSNPISVLYKMTNENGEEVDQTLSAFLDMNYEDGLLYLRGSNSLYACEYEEKNLRASVCMAELYSEYSFIYDATGALYGLGFIANDGAEKGVYNLYVSRYVDGVFTNPVKVTNLTDSSVESFVCYAVESGIQVQYVSVKDSEAEGEVTSVYKVEAPIKLEKSSDLVLQSVNCDVNTVDVGSPFFLTFTVWNNSLTTLNEIKVSFENSEGTVVFEKVLTGLALLPGETREIEVEISAISLENFTAEYQLKVQALDQAYAEEVDSMGIKLGYADITMAAKYVEVGEIKYFLVMVQNIGALPIDGFRLFVENGIVLASAQEHEYLYNLEMDCVLNPGEYKYFTIELNRVYFTEEYVTVTVTTNTEEFDTENNRLSYSMEKNEPVEYETKRALTYYLNGELMGEPDFYLAGENVTMREMEEREGYTFSGWSDDLDEMPNADVSVYGFYTKNRYTVTYSYKDGLKTTTLTDSFEFEANVSAYNPKYQEGKTFNGWYTDEALTKKYEFSTMPAKNLTLYGEYNVDKYTVTYYVDGEPLETTYEYAFGETIVLPAFEKAGHSFSGWSIESGTKMPSHDLKVYGTTQVLSYEITYFVSTGLVKQRICSVIMPYGTTLTLYEYVSPEGYKFDGWYEDEACEEDKLGASIEVVGNLTLYGKNVRNFYTLTYLVNNVPVHEVELEYGAEIPEYVYENEGYQFGGWEDVPEYMPAYDVSIFGGEKEIVYTVTYYVDNTQVGQDKYPIGADVNFRQMGDKEGRTFLGWTKILDAKGHSITLEDGRMPGTNIHVYGEYKTNSFKLCYFVDEYCVREETLEYGAPIQKWEDYKPSIGREFLGFEGIPETMPAGNLNVYGKTVAKLYTLTYKVDGVTVLEMRLPYGEKIDTYTYQSNKEGVTVSAWSNLPKSMPDRDVVVTATTSLQSYNLYYYVDGELVKTETHQYGEAITAYQYVAGKGRTFLGFGGVPETMPARDVEAHGSTTKTLYLLNYYVDGELVYSDTYYYDASIKVRGDYVRYGYTFKQWEGIVRRMPDHDLDVHGKFTKNLHNVYYYVSGELMYTDEYSFGDPIVLRGAESKEGYTFSGWSSVPVAMRDEDVTVTADFVKNVYEVTYYVNDVFYKTEKVAYGDLVDLSTFETDDYTVLGWKKDGKEVTELAQGLESIRLDAVVEGEGIPFTETKGFIIGVTMGGSVAVTSGVWAVIYVISKRKKPVGSYRRR